MKDDGYKHTYNYRITVVQSLATSMQCSEKRGEESMLKETYSLLVNSIR